MFTQIRHLVVMVANIAAIFFVPPQSFAQPPQSVLIQGQLLDSNGAPLTGARDYRVRFYDAASSGTQLGSDLTGQTMVSAEGLFAIPLVPPVEVLAAPNAWYELALDSTPVPDGVDGSDVFPDLIEVHSVPFARIAGDALHVDAENVGDGSVTQNEFATLSGVSGNIQTQMNTKADAANVYTQTEINNSQAAQDNAIAAKADASDILHWEVSTGGIVEPNHGYISLQNNAFFLMDSSSTFAVGDVVRISNKSFTLGCTLDLSSNQIIMGDSLIPDVINGISWTPRESSRNWYDVASSDDGTKLVAGGAGTNIYTSTNSGTNWTPRDSVRGWRAFASSADGTKLLAAHYNGFLYTSIDSGVSWNPRDSSRLWHGVASSSDGTNLVAVVLTGQIYTSTDSGMNWTPRDSNRSWLDVASSADGTKLVAVVLGGQIYTSTDSGVTWTPRESNRTWRGVASSSDGTKLVAAVSGGQIYTSTDSGVTWTPRDTNRSWEKAASSADGTKLVATVSGGRLFVSTNSGATWTPQDGYRTWRGVASSADGSKPVAVAEDDQIYIGPGSSGSDQLQFDPGSSVELVYIGDGTFVRISSEGTFSVL